MKNDVLLVAIFCALALLGSVGCIPEDQDTEARAVVQGSMDSASAADTFVYDSSFVQMPVQFIDAGEVIPIAGSIFVYRDEKGGEHIGSGNFAPLTGEMALYIGPVLDPQVVEDSISVILSSQVRSALNRE